MKSKAFINLAWTTVLLSGSLNVFADVPMRQARNPEEEHAVRVAKIATGGGQVLSTDRDWDNWDVDILRGCLVFEVEVDHESGQVSSRSHDDSACHNREKLIELRAKARRYLLR